MPQLPLVNVASPLTRHHLNRGLVLRLQNLPQGQWTRGTKWRDLCRRNDATFASGAAWVGPQGRHGGFGCVSANGASNHLTCTNDASLNISGPMTLAAWLKPSTGSTTMYVVKKATLSSVDGYELALSSAGKIFFRVNQFTSADTYRINSTTSFPVTPTWFHACAVYDGANLNLYLNGKSDATAVTGPASITTNSLALGIGAQPDGTSRFGGSYDDVRIWNRALSAAEVWEMYLFSRLRFDPTLNFINSRIAPAGNRRRRLICMG